MQGGHCAWKKKIFFKNGFETLLKPREESLKPKSSWPWPSKIGLHVIPFEARPKKKKTQNKGIAGELGQHLQSLTGSIQESWKDETKSVEPVLLKIHLRMSQSNFDSNRIFSLSLSFFCDIKCFIFNVIGKIIKKFV